ncbi:5-hydroxytryptamine receptor 3A-like [Acipenser ruthenus]|uniref:5-hydroxytryptamine receptor 3A-like n=1 Tax=Acipenser ruthenus TaxID=7906 RepID=UPI0027411562|nr:5-hydroxytryptamine receptor 3A-like [Acipenser ruthenus]
MVVLGYVSSKAVCRYHDVFEHLNISVDNRLLKFTRPVNDWRRPTVVYMDITLYSILAVIEKSQTFTAYIWVSMIWQNEFISWDPSEFCGISKILVPKELLWIPDISIYEFTDETTFPDLPYLHIDNNGKVEMLYSRRVVSTCNINVHQFPFDTQNCNLTFGSELQSINEITLAPLSNSSRVTDFSWKVLKSQGDWQFLQIQVWTNQLGMDETKWDQLIYEISMKRRSMLYVINFLLPSIFLLLLDIASFFISDCNGEKLGFKVTVILGLSVLLLILNDILPSVSNETPLIATFCIVIFAFMMASLLETILVMYLKTGTPACAWLRRKRSGVTGSPGRSQKSGREDTLEDITMIERLSGSSKPATEERIDPRLLEFIVLELQALQQCLLSSHRDRGEPDYWETVATRGNKVFFWCYLFSVLLFLISVSIAWTS